MRILVMGGTRFIGVYLTQQFSSDRFIKGITDRLTQLTQFPNMGRRRDEIFPGIRSLLYEKYLIFYTVTDEIVEINRVANGHQDLNQIFQR